MFNLSDVFDAEKGGVAGAAAPAVHPVAAAHTPAVFDHTAFTFRPCAYRIHFKNGHSGEYDGVVLAHTFPFDPREVERVEPVEEVGQSI